MAKDFSLDIRKIAVSRLKDAASVSDIVGARVYGPQPPANPTWPFVRYGFASTLPVRASCMDGSRVTVAIHGFARGPGEDNISALAAAIASTLDGHEFQGAGYAGHFRWTQTQIIRDTVEASDYHAICNFEIAVTG